MIARLAAHREAREARAAGTDRPGWLRDCEGPDGGGDLFDIDPAPVERAAQRRVILVEGAQQRRVLGGAMKSWSRAGVVI